MVFVTWAENGASALLEMWSVTC